MLWNRRKTVSERITVAALAAAAMLGNSAWAGGSVNVQTFAPVSSSAFQLTEGALAERPSYLNPDHYRRYLLGISYNYLHEPLVALDSSRENRMDLLVNGVQTVDVLAGIEWDSRFSVNLSVPMSLSNTVEGGDQFGLGNVRFFSKFYFSRDRGPLNVALIPEFRFPGSRDIFVADESGGWGLGLAFESMFGPVQAAFNIGYRGTPRAQFEDLDYRRKLPISLGLLFPLNDRFGLNAEASGAPTLPFNRYQNPTEIYAGLRYIVDPEMVVTGGGSLGSTNGVSSADWRFLVAMKYSPFADTRPPEPPAKTAPVAVVPAKPRVVFTPKRIEIGEEVRFEHASDVLMPSGMALLDEVANVIRKNRAGFKLIRIEGHTNEIGKDNYNFRLSSARANSVKQYLTTRGVDRDVMVTVGFGETKPKNLKDVSHDVELVADRRVEFRVIN